jgi:hypothetical protein
MGNWSEAVNDGVICKKCFVPLPRRGLDGPTLCEECERTKEGNGGKIGPDRLPPQ